MKVSRRIAVLPAREVERFAAHVAERAAPAESIRKQRVSFRPLSEGEAETLLGGELLAALSAAHRRA